MTDEDLRDCFAMFALVGAMISNQERTATDIWDIADDMISARKKEKEERDAFVKATYRECETCGNPNILRTEPSWKVNCIGCYVAKQNTNLCKGRCLIKLKN
jgi:ribosomal protein S27E